MTSTGSIGLKRVVLVASAGLLGACGPGSTAARDAGLTDALLANDAFAEPAWTRSDSGAPCAVEQAPGVSAHNPGQDCTRCHPWTVAGTLYATSGGGPAVSGATVRLIGSDERFVDVVTGPDGTFFTLEPVSFPALALVSKCPETRAFDVASGGCSKCHDSSTPLWLP
jgi:hypothetical protein